MSNRELSRRLPLLENVRIASPCNVSWDEMQGDERVRFCGSCEKHVYNLSEMAGDEAERLLAQHTEGSVCVRLYRRADGTVLTNDCPVGVRKKRTRRTLVAAAGAGAMAVAATAAFASSWRMPARGGEGVTATMGSPVAGDTVSMGAPMTGATAVPSLPPPVVSPPGVAVAMGAAAPPVKPPPAVHGKSKPTMGRLFGF
jgi:hypothetical protein